jgi:hypothetical protein
VYRKATEKITAFMKTDYRKHFHAEKFFREEKIAERINETKEKCFHVVSFGNDKVKNVLQNHK